MKRAAGLLVALATSALLTGCEAVSPVAPAPTATRLVVFFAGPIHTSIFFQLYAYVVDSDGVYTNVTNNAQWSVSTPAVAQFNNLTGGDGPAQFQANGPGTASILASYQNLGGFVTVTVPQNRFVSGPVRIDTGPGGFFPVGSTLTLTVHDVLQGRDLTSVSSWSSADPSIATVSPQGVVTAVTIGTTTISAAFGGTADSVVISVFPRRRAG